MKKKKLIDKIVMLNMDIATLIESPDSYRANAIREDYTNRMVKLNKWITGTGATPPEGLYEDVDTLKAMCNQIKETQSQIIDRLPRKRTGETGPG